jgi:hypothetical protein
MLDQTWGPGFDEGIKKAELGSSAFGFVIVASITR